MSEMLLLGAGASVDAGVPSAYDMTKAIAERFRGDFELEDYSYVISFVVGGLLFKAGQEGQDPLSAGVNVEHLFNAVQLLAERQTLEAAPFVGSWHAMVAEFDKVRPSRSSSPPYLFCEVNPRDSGNLGRFRPRKIRRRATRLGTP